MKRIILFTYGVLISICAAGQSASQVSAFGTFGVISGMMYDPDEGVNSIQFGYGGGFNYTYFFKPSFGLTVGAEALTFANRYRIDAYRGDDPAHDGDEMFRLQYDLTNYTENQTIISLLIPLMLHFETTGSRIRLFAAIGGKINFLLNASYTSRAEKLSTRGYYPQYEVTFLEDVWFMGFKHSENVASKGDLPLRTISPVFSAEAGFKIILKRDVALYLGGYVDYGIGLFAPAATQQYLNNDLSVTRVQDAFIKYNPSDPENYHNRINTVTYSQTRGEDVFVDNLALFSTGAKLKLAFNSDVITQKAAEPKSLDLDLTAETKPPPPVPAPAVTPLTNEAPPAEVKQQEQKGEEDNVPLIIKRRIPFTLKSAELGVKQKADLDDKARVLAKNPDIKIVVRGNANDFLDKKNQKDPKLKKAAEAKNKKLSKQRAQAIKDYLVSKGVGGGRIKVAARGSKSPLVPNTTPRNRNKNRRADFVMTEKK